MCFFCTGAFIFKMFYLCGYYELEGLPHHSSDVFFHGESISDRFTCVWTLYRSITWPLLTLCCVVQPKIRCNSVEIYGKSMKINEIQWKSMKINDISENSPLCSGFVMSVTHSSRWIECPNTRKSIGNGFPMKKIRRSCGAEVLPTRSSRRDRTFWK